MNDTTTVVDTWEPEYDRWRHGGWYVTNVRYPSGAVGCVSRNYPDRKWRIVCRDHGQTYPSRDAAARAERDFAIAETYAAEIVKLTSAQRKIVSDALRQADAAESDLNLIALVRADLRKTFGKRAKEATAVVFHTMEYDNGHFINDFGTVYFSDGTKDDLELGEDGNPLLNVGGACGSDAALGVDLRTGKVEFHAYSHTVYKTLRIAR